jgi:hypothetical protein
VALIVVALIGLQAQDRGAVDADVGVIGEVDEKGESEQDRRDGDQTISSGRLQRADESYSGMEGTRVQPAFAWRGVNLRQ